MSLGPMSHVEFKKRICPPVDFRGQGPYMLDSLLSSEEVVYRVRDASALSLISIGPFKLLLVDTHRLLSLIVCI